MKHHRPTRRRSRGFTLVEMLAVILIIGILVAIVVGVAGKAIATAAKARTRGGMITIMAAVEAYYDDKKVYPAQSGGTADARSEKLFAELKACPKSAERLSHITSDVMHDRKFYDGFEQVIDYRATGGTANGPYLLSAGQDGDFATQEDNIRSDKK